MNNPTVAFLSLNHSIFLRLIHAENTAKPAKRFTHKLFNRFCASRLIFLIYSNNIIQVFLYKNENHYPIFRRPPKPKIRNPHQETVDYSTGKISQLGGAA